MVFPVLSATVNLFVSQAIPPFAFKAPDRVVVPDTSNVPVKLPLEPVKLPVKEVAPVTLRVLFNTVALSAVIVPVKLPLEPIKSPVNVVAPVTPNVPPILVFPVVLATVNLFVLTAMPLSALSYQLEL